MDGASPRPDKPEISRGPNPGATQGRGRTPTLGFAFDYVDPGSYLASELLYRRLDAGLALRVDWRPLELRVPPNRLLDPSEPAWAELTRGIARQAEQEGVRLNAPGSIPWTRKAHELAFLAREEDRFDAVHRALFGAHFRSSLDIGRIDVLVAIGEEHGLQPAETRVVLGTDRFSEAVAGSTEALLSLGIRGVPMLWSPQARLEGLQSVASFDSFLTGVGREAAVLGFGQGEAARRAGDPMGGTKSEEWKKWPDT